MSTVTLKNFDIDKCQKYKKEELVKIVKKLKGDSDGTKEELCKRIKKLFKAKEKEEKKKPAKRKSRSRSRSPSRSRSKSRRSSSSRNRSCDDFDPKGDCTSYTIKQLKEFLENRGLKTWGNKGQMCKRLLDSYECKVDAEQSDDEKSEGDEANAENEKPVIDLEKCGKGDKPIRYSISQLEKFLDELNVPYKKGVKRKDLCTLILEHVECNRTKKVVVKDECKKVKNERKMKKEKEEAKNEEDPIISLEKSEKQTPSERLLGVFEQMMEAPKDELVSYTEKLPKNYQDLLDKLHDKRVGNLKAIAFVVSRNNGKPLITFENIIVKLNFEGDNYRTFLFASQSQKPYTETVAFLKLKLNVDLFNVISNKYDTEEKLIKFLNEYTTSTELLKEYLPEVKYTDDEKKDIVKKISKDLFIQLLEDNVIASTKDYRKFLEKHLPFQLTDDDYDTLFNFYVKKGKIYIFKNNQSYLDIVRKNNHIAFGEFKNIKRKENEQELKTDEFQIDADGKFIIYDEFKGISDEDKEIILNIQKNVPHVSIQEIMNHTQSPTYRLMVNLLHSRSNLRELLVVNKSLLTDDQFNSLLQLSREDIKKIADDHTDFMTPLADLIPKCDKLSCKLDLKGCTQERKAVYGSGVNIVRKKIAEEKGKKVLNKIQKIAIKELKDEEKEEKLASKFEIMEAKEYLPSEGLNEDIPKLNIDMYKIFYQALKVDDPFSFIGERLETKIYLKIINKYDNKEKLTEYMNDYVNVTHNIFDYFLTGYNEYVNHAKRYLVTPKSISEILVLWKDQGVNLPFRNSRSEPEGRPSDVSKNTIDEISKAIEVYNSGNAPRINVDKIKRYNPNRCSRYDEDELHDYAFYFGLSGDVIANKSHKEMCDILNKEYKKFLDKEEERRLDQLKLRPVEKKEKSVKVKFDINGMDDDEEKYNIDEKVHCLMMI